MGAVSDLTELAAAPASTDVLYIVDGGVSKKITVDNCLAGVVAALNATDIDAGASGTAGSVDVFPTTASKGKIAVTATDSAGNTTTTITNASHGQATTYTIPDIGGATGNVCVLTAAQAVAGTLTRADLTEEALQEYTVPLRTMFAADGAALGIAATAGDHFVNLGTNVLELRGEESISETETSVSYFQFALPPEYVDAGDVKVRLRCQVDGAGTDNSSTIDIEAYEQADGAVGADICATAAQGFAAKSTYYSKDFTVTAAGLVSGDVLTVKVTSAVIESDGSALAFYSEPPQMLLDIKG